MGVVGAFGVVVAVDEDSVLGCSVDEDAVLFGDFLFAVSTLLGAFDSGDEDCDGGDCKQDPPWEPAATVVVVGFGL